MAYVEYNPNPAHKRVGDCSVRALCKALGHDWITTYIGLMVIGLEMRDMPSSNAVWGAYLKRRGFSRRTLPETCPDCYTVKDFCAEHPSGTYVVGLNEHVVCVQNGYLYDSWDSSDEAPIYYWSKE